MSARREARRQLGDAAVYSEAEAIALLPCRDSTARAWLRERGLSRVTPMGRVVVWGDVVAEIRRAGEPSEPEPAAVRPAASLPRATFKRGRG